MHQLIAKKPRDQEIQGSAFLLLSSAVQSLEVLISARTHAVPFAPLSLRGSFSPTVRECRAKSHPAPHYTKRRGRPTREDVCPWIQTQGEGDAVASR